MKTPDRFVEMTRSIYDSQGHVKHGEVINNNIFCVNMTQNITFVKSIRMTENSRLDISKILGGYLCYKCVGEEYLSEVIKKERIRKCTYCQNRYPAITMLSFSQRLKLIFDNHYVRTCEYPEDNFNPLKDWEREGDNVVDLIVDIAGVDDKIANDAQAILEYKYGNYKDAEVGLEMDFEEGSQYISKDLGDDFFRKKWNKFRQLTQQNNKAKKNAIDKLLSEIFAGIFELKTWNGKSAIIEIGPLKDIRKLYRARVFHKVKNLLEAIQYPDQQLGPPSKANAKHGRMNRQGVSVFYGSEKSNVAISEVRPPVGSFVAVAEFEVLRNLKILDLSILNLVNNAGSLFDPDELTKRTRATFLRQLSDLISYPVMPGDESLEYSPTQRVADFLSESLGLDGIRFPSVQAGGREMNVTLFSHASIIEKIELPIGAKLDSSQGFDYEDYSSDYTVKVVLPQKFQLTSSPPSNNKSTLRVNSNTITVNEIKATKFEFRCKPVDRYEEEPLTTSEIDLNFEF